MTKILFKINKRIRYDQSKSIESENQPPRATIQHRSLFLFHPRHHVQIQNEITPTFNETLPNYHEFCDLRVNHLFENDTLIDPIQKSTCSIYIYEFKSSRDVFF